MRVKIAEYSDEIRTRWYAILVCALVGSLGIVLLDALLIKYDVYYYSDDINVLYPVAVHSLTGSLGNPVRPLEYLIVLGANYLYLPLWLGASLLCVIGATILSALACERLFDCQLPKAGWWILGLANPLLFQVVSQPDIVSQALCNLLFAAAMLAFVSELDRLWGRPMSGWRADSAAISLNVISAGLFFTKETATAAAVIIPLATALIRLKARRLSPIFLFSLLLPIAAAGVWILLKLKFPIILPTTIGEGRMNLKLSPIEWGQNFLVTLAFPVTPLPASFIGFDLLRPLWVAVALGSVVLFLWLLSRKSRRQPRIVVPLLVIAASCAPMILIHPSENYSTMIAPFAISVVLFFGVLKMRWVSLAYGLLLYAASVGNAVIYCLGADFNLFGLQHLEYSIYGKEYQYYPICSIGTTAHVGWDGTSARELPFHPEVKGRITCVR